MLQSELACNLNMLSNTITVVSTCNPIILVNAITVV